MTQPSRLVRLPDSDEADSPRTVASDGGPQTVNTVGEKLRYRRKIRQLSLHDVAQSAGISIGMLSQIERGLSMPSLRMLRHICAALDMPMAWLFDADEEASQADHPWVVRQANRRRMDLGNARFTKEILSSDSTPQLQLMHFVIRPGYEPGPNPNQRPTGARAGTVIAGQLRLIINGRDYVLGKGDSFSFEANVDYRFWCEGDVECEVIWVATPALY